MLKIAILGLVWIICGFFTYGFVKGSYKKLFQHILLVGHDRITEVVCLACGIWGPLGLFAALALFITEGKKESGFCLKMPKELKRGYGGRR